MFLLRDRRVSYVGRAAVRSRESYIDSLGLARAARRGRPVRSFERRFSPGLLSFCAPARPYSAQSGPVLACAHGWFNRMMRPHLREAGWQCIRDGGDTYWSYRQYEYRPR